VWFSAQGENKAFLHGLIQIAAAFHHHTRQNPAGFRSLLEKGCAKLAGFGEWNGIDVAGLRRQLQPWQDALLTPPAQPPSGGKTTPLPRIALRGAR
jgi:hypothetical protein